MPAQSLSFRHNPLAAPQNQLELLEGLTTITPFEQKLADEGLNRLRPLPLETFQINIGKMCNQVCAHCHVDAGPKRTETMDARTADKVLEVLAAHPEITTLDITGGVRTL